MRKVIITGKNGYISTNLKNWMDAKDKDLDVELLDLREDSWKDRSFEDVETIIHTSALVHKNEIDYPLQEYRRINRDLTIELAEKAKSEGVTHFIYISSMAVYGVDISCFKNTEITKTTPLIPTTKYGISKLEAEFKLLEKEDEFFKVSIIRPPFVYGKNCPGNYQTLKKLTMEIGVIPKIKNYKSMIFIDNLCECIYQIFKHKCAGIFTPQNAQIQSTYKLSLLIAKYNNKKVLCSYIFAPFVLVSSLFVNKIRKAFGNEFYSNSISQIDGLNYNVISFEESVKLTEQ